MISSPGSNRVFATSSTPCCPPTVSKILSAVVVTLPHLAMRVTSFSRRALFPWADWYWNRWAPWVSMAVLKAACTSLTGNSCSLGLPAAKVTAVGLGSCGNSPAKAEETSGLTRCANKSFIIAHTFLVASNDPR